MAIDQVIIIHLIYLLIYLEIGVIHQTIIYDEVQLTQKLQGNDLVLLDGIYLTQQNGVIYLIFMILYFDDILQVGVDEKQHSKFLILDVVNQHLVLSINEQNDIIGQLHIASLDKLMLHISEVVNIEV